VKRKQPAVCPNEDLHTTHPQGYVAFADWADEKSKTHHQVKCPGCGLYAIWVPNKKEVGLSTTQQREAMKKLAPLGYEPQGYTSNGELIMTHPVGYTITLHKTPSDHHSMKNLVAEAERGVKRMNTANHRFQSWLWEKYSVQPGEEKRVELSLVSEVRQFFEEKGIHRGASSNAVIQWIREQPSLNLETPGTRGKGPHWYILSRPPAKGVPEVVQPPEPELVLDLHEQPEPETLDTDSTEISGKMSVRAEDGSYTPIENEPKSLDEGLIRRLEAAFNEPVLGQLSEQRERLSLVQSELESMDAELVRGIESMNEARRMILTLTQLLEG
jgi:hypothetical protein